MFKLIVRRCARHLVGPIALAVLSMSAGTALAAKAPGSKITFVDTAAGVTPFISYAKFTGSALANLTSVTFTIDKQPGAAAKPVKVTYSALALQNRGALSGNGVLQLPVFGLYAGKTNPVTVTFNFKDGSTQNLSLSVKTKTYTDPLGVYDHPVMNVPRDPKVKLGWNYMYMKSGIGAPVVVDTDGAMRWLGGAIDGAFSSTFDGSKFVIGIHEQAGIYNMQLDGTFTETGVDDPRIDWFNHNIVKGRDALLTGVDITIDGVVNMQSTIAEMTDTGHVVREWDFAQIIRDYMTAHGDDPSGFVRPPANWLHINSSMYDATDNSLTISSREQFVMKIDYDTNEIKWILGDPTKSWYTYPSLRAKAITLPDGAMYPIGQHMINKANDGSLLLFNNGAPSNNMPKGVPAGDKRNFSAANAYTIDPVTMTGQEVFRYTHDKTLLSKVCSSAVQAADGSMLVDYAAADDTTHTYLIGMNAGGKVGFEFMYGNKSCATGWNTIPIAFEGLVINN